MVVEISPCKIRSTASIKSGDLMQLLVEKPEEIVRTGNIKCSRFEMVFFHKH